MKCEYCKEKIPFIDFLFVYLEKICYGCNQAREKQYWKEECQKDRDYQEEIKRRMKYFVNQKR